MEDIINFTGLEIKEKIKANSLERSEVYSFFRNRIKKVDSQLNSFIDVYEYDNGEREAAYTGLPIAIKDNICIKGKKITCASKILSSHLAQP